MVHTITLHLLLLPLHFFPPLRAISDLFPHFNPLFILQIRSLTVDFAFVALPVLLFFLVTLIFFGGGPNMIKRIRLRVLTARNAQEAPTLFTATVAPLLRFANRLELVVKCQLFVRTHGTSGEKADPQLTIHSPLLSLTVRLTAVVKEATYVALLGGVDEHVIVQGHEVKVLVILGRIFLGALLELLYVYDLANVLN